MATGGDGGPRRDDGASPEEETAAAAANESFVKKVTSRVSGFLPSSLSKWFGSTETSVRPRDDSDSDDDESLLIQPPAKRAKAEESPPPLVAPRASLTVGNHRFVEVPPPSPIRFPDPPAGPSGYSRRPAVSSKAALNSSPLAGDGESTSGYSSSIWLQNRESPGAKPVTTTMTTRAQIVSPEKSKLLFNSTPTKPGRSLFSDRTSSPHMNTSLSSRQPSFNTTAFGSSNFVDRTLSSKRILDSPFYNGRTTYGGASAYGRRLAHNSPTASASSRTVQVKPINDPEKKSSSGSASLSKTARRILNTLEQYTAPTADAKKIPNPPRKMAPRYGHANPYAIRETKVPSNRELQVPTVPDLLKMKEKMQETTVSVRRIANASKSSLNTEEYKIATLEDDGLKKHSNKIKNRISSVRDKPEPRATVAELKLPDVQLPITTLPVFNFTIPAPSASSNTSKAIETKTSTTTTIKTTEKIIVDSAVRNIETKKTEEVVKEISTKKDNNKTEQNTTTKQSDRSQYLKRSDCVFSDPIVLSEKKTKFDHKPQRNRIPVALEKGYTTPRGTINGTLEHSASKTEYIFSDPVPIIVDNTKKKSLLNNNNTNTQSKNDLSQFKVGKDKWECDTCMVRNDNSETKCIACSAPKINGSVKVTNLKSVSTDNFFFKHPETWECPVCMIVNRNDRNTCAACSSPKIVPKQENGILEKPDIKPFNILEKFKPPVDTWQCNVCMINNKNDLTKCAACSEPRIQKASYPTKPLLTFDLVDKFKADGNTWECSVCKVRNKADITTCVSGCSTIKVTKPTQNNGFGEKFNKPNDQWECDSCMVRNSNDKEKCACCDTPKPGSNQTSKIPKETKPVSSFNFGVVSNEAVNKMFSFGSKTMESVPEKAVNSVFGLPITTPAPPTFSFGIKPIESTPEVINTPKESIVVEEKKVVTLPEISVSIAPPEVTPPVTTNIRTPIKSTFNGDINKTPILFGNIPPENSTPKPTFTFGTPSKPQNALEVPPNSTTPSTQLFTFGSTPAKTTSSSLFPTNTSTPSLTLTPKSSTPAIFKFGAPISTTASDPNTTPTVSTQPTNQAPMLFGNVPPKPMMTFGSNATPQPASGGFSFNTVPTNPAPAVPPPVQNGTVSFGVPSEPPKATPAVFSFGGGQNSAPGVFNFRGASTSGSSSSASTNSGGFNFSGSADIKPSFNFTTGTPSSAFSAPPNSSGAEQRRVFKRAIRRTQR